MKRIALAGIFIANISGFPALVMADADIQFRGTLVEAPPCTINDDEMYTVDFGEVLMTRVNTTAYSQNFSISVKCTTNQKLRFKVSGTPGDGAMSETTFSSGVKNLVIHLYMSGIADPLTPGKWFELSPNMYEKGYVNMNANLLSLAADLKGGAFRAGTTFVIDYP